MIFNSGYYHSLDRTDYTMNSEGEMVEAPIELSSGEKPLNLNLGPKQIGTNVNPFQHQLQALNAKIKEGAGKVEFEFFGTGKGNKERATPESFDKEERAEMRNLARINEVESSTHATVGITGIAGFDPQRGFEEQNREQSIKEIKRAIDFAGDASTGGAIVFHTGEWNRPIYDSFAKDRSAGETFEFSGFPGEDRKAPIMVADARTGELKATRKDSPIYEPVFKTVADFEKEKGIKLVGTEDEKGNTYEKDDWIGVAGETIKRDWEFDPKKSEAMFRRVPDWNKKDMRFETVSRNWNHFQDRATEWNQNNPDRKLTPEEIFTKTQYMNQVLQAKGHSLFYAQRYDREKETLDEARKALRREEKMLREDPDNPHKWTDKPLPGGSSERVKIVDHLKEEIRELEAHMRHTHEASASADVQAKQAQDAMEHITTVEQYGLKKTAESLAELGIQTWQKYEANKDKLNKPLFVAPENWNQHQYGSHPDELIKIVKEGRQKMIERLTPSMGESKAKQLAETHIKSTFDIGHLNMWKSHLKRKTDKNGIPIESEDELNKRFAKWTLGKLKKMDEEKILGHIHLSDNFGFDDEHLTPGKGNAPIKEMMKFLSEKGYDDFIAEASGFNPGTILPETWSYFGSPVYSVGTSQATRFSGIHKQHFGYDAPPMYIVGGYAPSNEWKLWSEVPLE